MTPQQIKDNAPEEATHYETNEEDVFYYKLNINSEWFIWNECDEPFDPWWDGCIIDFDVNKLKPL